METIYPQNFPKYSCAQCHIKTNNKKDFEKHLATAKHLRWSQGDAGDAEGDAKFPISESFSCENCNRKYRSRNGIWKHKKICLEKEINLEVVLFNPDDEPTENIILHTNTHHNTNNDITTLTGLVIEVVKNNSEFQKQMLDMCKNMQSNIISNNCNNTTNSNNTFNLQIFLNEHCKDAMNISEFIDSFDLQISDLENVGRVGYIEGMSNIIINKIKELDVSKRPIHCSDLKREIIYIKDDDVWEREDANNTKFRKVIKKVAGKNIGMLNDWRDMYPECMDVESEYNDIFVKLTRTAMGPSDTEATEAKIMKKIVKHIVIDKKMLAGAGGVL